MKNNSSLLFCMLFFLIVQPSYSQYQNVRVSKLSTSNPEEVTIAINTKDPQILAAGSNLNYFYYSTNGGEFWAQKILTSSFGVWGDPCVIFDGLGNLFYAHLSNPPTFGYWIDRIVVQKSTDHGIHWDDGVGVGFNSPKNQDKEWLAVDLTSSIYRDNIYMSWTEFDSYGSSNPNDSTRILLAYSSDQGITWSIPVKVSDISGNCIDSDSTVEGAVPAIGPEGEVYVSWAGPLGIVFDKSLDGGKTFGKDIFVTDIPGGWDFGISGIYRANGMPITACDISNSNYRGNIYINWSDQRNGVNNTDIFFVKSVDGGQTWGNIVKVNNDSTSRHQFFTWMTVDQSNGNIYIVFYDRRNTTGLATDVYIARSIDGGETFENYKISESSFTPQSNIFFGDYINIAAYNGIIRPIWMRMDDINLSVWTALISDSTLLTDVQENKGIDLSYRLFQNYPNPFNPSTTISYQIPQKSFVAINVFDILGRKITTLVKEIKSSGTYEVDFDGSNLSSGIYFYTISAGKFRKTQKMVLME